MGGDVNAVGEESKAQITRMRGEAEELKQRADRLEGQAQRAKENARRTQSTAVAKPTPVPAKVREVAGRAHSNRSMSEWDQLHIEEHVGEGGAP